MALAIGRTPLVPPFAHGARDPAVLAPRDRDGGPEHRFNFLATSNGIALPEPAPAALLTIGLVAAVLARRRRAS